MKTKIGTIIACCIAFTGCTLNHNVPKATISFNPTTKVVNISSHKDVSMTNLSVKLNADNSAELTIGNYESKVNVEVIRAAVEAQQRQIISSLETINKLLDATSAVAK